MACWTIPHWVRWFSQHISIYRSGISLHISQRACHLFLQHAMEIFQFWMPSEYLQYLSFYMDKYGWLSLLSHDIPMIFPHRTDQYSPLINSRPSQRWIAWSPVVATSRPGAALQWRGPRCTQWHSRLCRDRILVGFTCHILQGFGWFYFDFTLIWLFVGR